MKLNRWTAALAAAGIVTVPSLVHAQTNTVLTALSSTTLSGYVDTSAQWNFGTGNANNPPYAFGGASKADGFNLDVVDLALDKPEDEGQWASGYHFEAWMGPDANFLGTQRLGTGDFAVRQAYVLLRTPIGNGVDWKIGVFDTIIGYEAFNSPNNPNYTRSYGFTIEPSQHTGLLGTYNINDMFSVSAGIADTIGPVINQRAVSPFAPGVPNESFKTYMASVTMTAPKDWGWMNGSTVSAGIVNGWGAGAAPESTAGGVGARLTSFYAGATMATPVTGLKAGASFDYLSLHDGTALVDDGGNGDTWALGLYGSFQATEKLALNVRGEVVHANNDSLEFNSDGHELEPIQGGDHLYELTITAQYDLWKNVLTRIEFRWDHSEHGDPFGGNAFSTGGLPTGTTAGDRSNASMLAANIIYKF